MTDKNDPNMTVGREAVSKMDEERYRDLINLTSTALWEMDKEARYTYLTDNVTDFLGATPEEMLGRSFFEFVADEDQESVRALFLDYWIERKPFDELECLILHKSGRKRVMEINGRPLFDADGALLGYRGTCRDVTDRHLTLEALRKAHEELLSRVEEKDAVGSGPSPHKPSDDTEDRLNEIFKDAQQWYWETDIAHKLVMISGGWSSFATTDQEWFMGKRMDEVVHRNYSSKIWDHIGSLMEGRSPINGLVFREKDRSGTMRFVRITATPRFTGEGEFDGYTGWCVDVTEEIKARDEAEIQRQRLLEAVDQMEEGLLLIDAERNVIAYNKSYANHLPSVKAMLKPGVRYEDVLRAILEAKTIKEAIGREEEWLAERLKAQTEHRKPPPISLVDGRWAQLSDYPLKNGETLLLRRDITKDKKHEEALRQAKEYAELANRAKSDFLANMSHELRTPLNAIIGFSDIMAREMFGPLNNETYLEYVAAIRDSGNHLLELISDILDVSRIEAGVMGVQDTEIDLRDLIVRCLGLLTDKAAAKKVDVQTHFQAGAWGLIGDPRRLRQIFINLISNAVKFTRQGGLVVVEAFVDEGCVTFSVADTGIGIAAEDLDKVFETFVQLQRFDTKENEGTGLGLPLTKALVELHGGSIRLTSRPGDGTTATVVFPKERTLQKLTETNA